MSIEVSTTTDRKQINGQPQSKKQKSESKDERHLKINHVIDRYSYDMVNSKDRLKGGDVR